MRITDIYPSKSEYGIKETVDIIIVFNSLEKDERVFIDYNVYHLNETIQNGQMDVQPSAEEMHIKINIDTDKKMSGYGVEVELRDQYGILQTVTTAFDILETWEYAPRYGFLSDFAVENEKDQEALEILNKYHINMVQFYDWMYRHHQLIPETRTFIDPLGRELSITAVENKIKYAHKYGMKAMAYGAVYGAGESFYIENKNSALYKHNGEPLGFGNFLYIMDISRDTMWHDHIIREFEKALNLGFDGIHMDQYGFPKEAVGLSNGVKTVRRLRDDFPTFINDVKDYLCRNGQNIPISFNAVNNWPVEMVAKSREDCVYIEVWPPNYTYQDLYNIISNTKRYAPSKQVVLAAYIKPYSEEMNLSLEYAQNTAIMTMATIFACGGFHLLIGEKNGILNDQYFPLYRKMEIKDHIDEMRSYYDFIVRYEELLYDFELVDNSMVCTGGLNGEYVFKGEGFSPKAEANKVWTLIKEKPGYKIINLINFTGIENMNWNEVKYRRPAEVDNIEVNVLVSEDVKGIFIASPDFDICNSRELDFEYIEHGQGRAVSFKIPKLKIWDMVYLVFDKN